MSYGRLSAAQKNAIKMYVKDRRVHDLGSGDFALSAVLHEMGAKVTAVDYQTWEGGSRVPAGVEFVQSRFKDFVGDIDVAFVSWPANNMNQGLVELLQKATKVIYLGKNTDGTACGNPELFRYLSTRRLHAYLPDRHNNLLVVGERLREPRPLTGEELAGIDQSRVYSHQETTVTATGV
jgi:hypothetical protein